jgi:hypothetical protein
VAAGVPARIVRRREDYAQAGGEDEPERAEPQVTTSA